MRRDTLAAVIGMLLLVACKKPEPAVPEVEHAWVRLPPIPGNPAAGYFELHAGKSADRLLGVASPKAASIELHQTLAASMVGTKTGDVSPTMTSMRPIASVPMPPGSVTTFQPGGYHLMLMGLDRTVRKGSRVPLHFRLASGRTVDAQADVVSAGDPAPSPAHGG